MHVQHVVPAENIAWVQKLMYPTTQLHGPIQCFHQGRDVMCKHTKGQACAYSVLGGYKNQNQQTSTHAFALHSAK